MKKREVSSILLVSAMLLSFAGNAFAGEEKKEDSVKLNFSGFVRYDAFYDTRQITSSREGSLSLYPKAVKKNAAGLDENSDSNLNFNSFLTRGTVKITTPDVFGAKVLGLIEGDFFGPTEAQISSFGLRHSYLDLKWDHVDLLIGQSWSPLFTANSVVPKVINFNTGMPFEAFARNPQITFTYKPVDIFKLLASATMERDGFSEIGGNVKQQRAGMPAVHLQTELGNSNYLVGLGGFAKTIKPEPLSQNFQAMSGTAYAKAKIEGFTFQAKGIYGGDLADHLMLGGYAQTTDNKAVPLNVASGWVDLDYELDKCFSFGLFGGYTANLGALELAKVAKDADGKDKFFARDQNMSTVFRVSPRIVYTIEKLKFALEYEYTSALYASSLGDKLQPVVNTSKDSAVANSRIQFSTFLSF